MPRWAGFFSRYYQDGDFISKRRYSKRWTKDDLKRDRSFVAEQELTKGANEVYVNGDSFIPEAKALEPVFKARMFAGVDV